ncbi:uncharacterized protein C9orf85 homolog [Impatiens glandulifera]|uniref:uncharacterized protein C9orf85 homolog n=1 Tax=Impatiens glandulifera TaxID=253017 RepID=UPI001FB0CD62|nr:uncharacterized protein C9orf85 homolog [Impatiens glandulifera]
MSGGRKGPPVHANKFAWKPHAGVKINETEVGGRFRPFSEITGVCFRCKEQIDWKRKYGKYKVLKEPTKCQRCTKRAVRQAYHNLCHACAKEHKVCAKCCIQVGKIIGRDVTEVEAEQKLLDEGIKNARERDRRTLIRQMNKGKLAKNSAVTAEVSESLAAASLEENAEDDDEISSEDDDEDQISLKHMDKGKMPQTSAVTAETSEVSESLPAAASLEENAEDDDEFGSEDDDEDQISD